MSKILEKALEKVRSLPNARQDQIGEWLIDVIEQDQSKLRLAADQEQEVRRRIANPEQPASQAETDAFFGKFK